MHIEWAHDGRIGCRRQGAVGCHLGRLGWVLCVHIDVVQVDVARGVLARWRRCADLGNFLVKEEIS